MKTWHVWAIALLTTLTLMLALAPFWGCSSGDDDDDGTGDSTTSPDGTLEPTPTETPGVKPTPYPEDYSEEAIVTPCQKLLAVYLSLGNPPPPGCLDPELYANPTPDGQK